MIARATREPGGDWSVVDNGAVLAQGLDRDEADTLVGELRETYQLYQDRPSRRLTASSR